MTTPQGDQPGPAAPLPAGASAVPSATLPSADQPTAALPTSPEARPHVDGARAPSLAARSDAPRSEAPARPARVQADQAGTDGARLGAGGMTGQQPVRGAGVPPVGPDGATRRPGPPRTVPARPVPSRGSRAAEPAARPAGRSRRAKLALQRIDPWSVFVFTLVASLFLGVALVVAVAALYSVLGSLGVLSSINELYVEVVGGDAGADPLFTASRFLGGAAVLAAVNVVLLTLLATLGSLLYNLCASFTGGIEVTLGERE